MLGTISYRPYKLVLVFEVAIGFGNDSEARAKALMASGVALKELFDRTQNDEKVTFDEALGDITEVEVNRNREKTRVTVTSLVPRQIDDGPEILFDAWYPKLEAALEAKGLFAGDLTL